MCSRWEIRAASEPRVLRPCPRCDSVQPFVSSGRFRVNGNGRRLDVWLVYRCAACDRTWNRTVHERVTPQELGERLPAYEANNPELAQLVARSGGVGPVEAGSWELVVGARSGWVRLAVDPGLDARLDLVLARGLGLSRSQVAQRFRHLGKSLRRPVRDGQRVALDEVDPASDGAGRDTSVDRD